MKQKVRLPKLLDYQKELYDAFANDDIFYITFLKSRQSGGSYFNKWIVTYIILTQEKKKIGYCTPTTKLGRLFYTELCKSLEPFILSTNASELNITFKSGCTLQFISSEQKESVRGFQFHYTVIDEAAFQNETFLQTILKPTWTILGQKVILCSTPNGNSGFFYDHVQMGLNKTNRYFTKVISIYDNPFITEEVINEIKKTIPEKVFKQEYLGEFLDGSGTVFTNFKNCINENPSLTGKYYAAIDWAKQSDYTVLTIINDLKQVVFIYRVTGLDYTIQVKKIVEHLNQWKPIMTISEENNIGSVINEMLKEQYSGQIKQVWLDNGLKKENIEKLIVAFEQKEIGIPNDDSLLRELAAFTCIYNPQNGNVKYTAPNGLHDDMVISLSYAFSLVKTKSGNYNIR